MSEDYKLYTNLALLTYPRQGIEYCEEVSKKFRMTNILSMKDFENLKVEPENNIGEEIESIKDIAKVYENIGTSKFYRKSDFSKVEDYLKNQKKYDINIK